MVVQWTGKLWPLAESQCVALLALELMWPLAHQISDVRNTAYHQAPQRKEFQKATTERSEAGSRIPCPSSIWVTGCRLSEIGLLWWSPHWTGRDAFMEKEHCVAFSHMQIIHSLPQQELLTGWSSMKGGREWRRDWEREEERHRESTGGKNREKERLTGSAPLLPLAIKEVRTQSDGGGEREGPTYASSSAARQLNPYITGSSQT